MNRKHSLVFMLVGLLVGAALPAWAADPARPALLIPSPILGTMLPVMTDVVVVGGGGAFPGGSITSPVFAPAADNCTTPPYSFTGDTDTGICQTAADRITFRTAGVNVASIENSGAQWARIGNKALTLGGGAVAFVRVAIAQESFGGGIIRWCATAADASAEQIRCGLIPFAMTNSGGTEVCTVGTPAASTEAVSVTSGTFTVAFTAASNAADTCDFSANGSSSLTETSMSINYTLEMLMAAPAAVTPQ